MHQQAQLRLKKAEVERLGAEAYVVLATDLARTRAFKEENLLLAKVPGPLFQDKSFVFATALSDAAGHASALYGVSRKCLRWSSWVENRPTWFVIDRRGTITYIAQPTLESPTSFVTDVDLVLEALREAAR